MKALEVYDKDSGSKLEAYSQNIFLTMKKLFKEHPEFSSINYYRNLEDLLLIKTEPGSLYDLAAIHDGVTNTILYENEVDIAHEIFHTACYNKKTEEIGFITKSGELGFALYEGMTEYFQYIVFKESDVDAYYLETFCVIMMKNIPDIFKYYFKNGFRDFLNLFPNKKDIVSLLYSLDFYCKGFQDIANNYFVDYKELKKAVYDSFDSLIDIGLEFCHSTNEKKNFMDKYMMELKNLELGQRIGERFKNGKDMVEFSSRLEDYSYKLIKKKIYE